MEPIFSDISRYPPPRIDTFPKRTVSNLVKALKNKSPEQQRNMIGDFLYRLVEQIEPVFTAKVTGMLLEMDRTLLFWLMESPHALREKVKEAIEVLGDWIPQQYKELEKEAYGLQASMLLPKL
ncbi:hypothetical protein Rs2_26670 [Raphanus sativus]|uniref:Polyadenylate-binding protein 2-like n=1 Tax=Raphanus sativus TaxID=3726 RepID=A0A9W3BUD4_RAPSA|nr:polyadenylate-binding protein 2-like [Raphanus sativus]KAJ4886922.1 hypothetical protein Rs2_26670 [Raphanus sativus]